MVFFLIFISKIGAQCVGFQVIGFNSDNPDEVVIEATSDIPGGTVFYITDNEWNGSTFNSGEQIVTYTAPSGGIASGSTISFTSSQPGCGSTNSTSVPLLSTSGEEIYITSVFPSGGVGESDICFSVIFGGSGNVTANGVDLGNTDNAVFNGGDVTNASNWTTSNTALTLPGENCTILPVKLIDFEAIAFNEALKVKWETAEEINNSHFELMHSTDGINFKFIGRVSGTNSSDITSYEFMHLDARPGLNYYQLKQVDFDGQYEIFGPVYSSLDHMNLRFYPTVANDVVHFRGELVQSDYIIFTMDGRIVQSGLIQNDVDISQLNKGMYIIQYNGVNERLFKN